MLPAGGMAGIVALEVMVILVVLLAVVSIAVPLFLNREPVDRINTTYKKLLNIKRAIVGDRERMVEKRQMSFGFVGDLGVLPGNLQELRINTGRPVYQQYPGTPMFFGWNGPYLGHDSDLLDAWGETIRYTQITPVMDPANGLTRIVEITSDNLDAGRKVYIYREEVSNQVGGAIVTRTIPHQTIISENDVVEVFYPDGAAVINRTYPVVNGVYVTADSIPVGHRIFERQSNSEQRFATLNHGGSSVVNFIGIEEPSSSPFAERTFYNTDDISAETGSLITPTMGTWSPDHLGTYYASGTGEHRAVFGRSDWDNYRVEVDATLYQGRGYGIYYRCDGQTDITGYVFQYDPGLYSPSGAGVEFVIRKVYQGDENYFPASDRFLARVNMSSAEFFSRFGTSIYNDQHHISITVNDDRHIIKVDGQEIIDVTDTEPLFPCGGLCGSAGLRSWDGQHYTDFHHILAYPIPPVPTGEFVWWSFEEGGEATVYGSGFEIDAPELNGQIYYDYDCERVWNSFNIHGKCLRFNGSNWGNVSFGNIFAVRASDTFSISLWFRMDSFSESRKYTLLNKTNRFGQNNSRGWELSLRKPTGRAFGVEFTLHAIVGNNDDELAVLNDLDGNGLQADTWYHVVVTYDGSGYAGGGNQVVDPAVLGIYVTAQDQNQVDGSPNLAVIKETLRSRSNTQNGVALKLGVEIVSINGFYGYVDELKMYYDALALEEIEELFQRDK